MENKCRPGLQKNPNYFIAWLKNTFQMFLNKLLEIDVSGDGYFEHLPDDSRLQL